jgi:hypothetical protein
MKNEKNMLTGKSFILRHLFILIAMFLCLPIINLGQGNNSGQKVSEVAHDATLTGKGTTESPLGVASCSVSTDKIATGAVTAPKLATDNTPQAGQVLSFNGTALSWQTPTAAPTMGGALRVVDSTGAQVGLLDSSSNAIRYMSSLNIWLRFSIDKFGIGSLLNAQNQNAFVVLYDETNCQGNPYMQVGRSLFIDARVIGFNAYFPSGPGEIKDIKSIGSLLTTACNTPGNGNSSPFDNLAPMQTVPISNLGTPPFKVSQ